MLTRITRKLDLFSKPASRCTSPTLVFDLSVRRFSSPRLASKLVGKQGVHKKVKAIVSPAKMRSTGCSRFSTLQGYDSPQDPQLTPELGFENLCVPHSRHRVNCYTQHSDKHDDTSEYEDAEEVIQK